MDIEDNIGAIGVWVVAVQVITIVMVYIYYFIQSGKKILKRIPDNSEWPYTEYIYQYTFWFLKPFIPINIKTKEANLTKVISVHFVLLKILYLSVIFVGLLLAAINIFHL